MKIYWVSRHDLSPAQLVAIRTLHGEDAEIVKDPVVFSKLEGLAEYIESHSDGFVYAVAGAAHYIAAADRTSYKAGYASIPEVYTFGVFENHPAKRADGSFGLAAVYHISSWGFNNSNWENNCCRQGEIKKVWENPDPASDQGEALIPVKR